MREDPLALLPEVALLVGAVAALLLGSYLPRQRQWASRTVAVVALVASLVASATAFPGASRTVYGSSFTVDTATSVARIVVVTATLLVIGLGVDELAGHKRESETYTLMLLSATGTCVLAGASDLLLLTVGFLLASIPLYGLLGLAMTPRSTEATLKTYLLGALMGIALLLGITMLTSLAGDSTYVQLRSQLGAAPKAAVAVGVVCIIAGLMFEAGGVPGHFWVPDAAQGANVTAAAFLTTVPKVGAIVALYRLVTALPAAVDTRLLLGIFAVSSMTLGNLAAFGQRVPRRLLGWSTVSQVGYLLVPVAVAGRSPLAQPALLLYLAGYAVTNLTAFAVTAALPQEGDIEGYRGLATRHPWLAAALLAALLGLVGTPPSAVFVGKVTAANAGWDGGDAWLAVGLLLNTLLSLYYYLRWLSFAYRPPKDAGSARSPDAHSRPWASSVAVIAGAASIMLGLGGGFLWNIVRGSFAA